MKRVDPSFGRGGTNKGKRVRRGTLRAYCYMAGALLVGLLWATSAQAKNEKQPEKIKFDIPSGPLSQSLRQYAQASGVAVLFAPDIVRNQVSKSLKGEFSTRDGLEHLLRGSGLVHRQGELGAVLIVKSSRPASSQVNSSLTQRDDPINSVPVEVVVVANGPVSGRAYKSSLQIVDAQGLREIGALPSGSVAEVLGRLPGIHLTYDNGDLLQPRIRGLTYLQTLIDGKEVASAGYRNFQLGDIPGDGVKSVVVYKTASADQVEGSVGGLVDIQTNQSGGSRLSGRGSVLATFRTSLLHGIPQGSFFMKLPFGREGRGGVALSMGQVVDKSSMNYSSAVYVRSSTLFDSNNDGLLGEVQDSLIAPVSIQDANITREYKRTSFVLNGHWSLGERSKLVASYLSLNVDERLPQNSRTLTAPETNTLEPSSYDFQSSTAGFVYAGIYTGGSLVSSGGYSAPNRHVEQASLSGQWQGDQATVRAGYDFTRGKTTVDYRTLSAKARGTSWAFSGMAEAKPSSWVLGDAELDDPGRLLTVSYNSIVQRWATASHAGRIDFAFPLARGTFTTLQFGVRRSSRTSRAELTNRNEIVETTLSDLRGLIATDIQPGGVAIDPDLLKDAVYLKGQLKEAGPLISLSAQSHSTLSETISAAYIRGLFGAAVNDLPIDGDIGVRLVRTATKGNGVIRGSQATEDALSFRDGSIDCLPSATVRLGIGESVWFKGAVSKSLGRPSPEQLSVNTQLDGLTLTGVGGNPGLKPFTSMGWDVGFDWYFSGAGYLSGAFFWKKLDGFFELTAYQERFAGQTFTVTRPSNGAQAWLNGLEISYAQKYIGLPRKWAGLGTDVNLTLLGSSKTAPNARHGQPMTAVPKYVLNVMAYYESTPWYIRINYQRSSSYFNNDSFDHVSDAREKAAPYSTVDATMHYEFAPRVKLTISALNVTNAERRIYSSFGGLSHNRIVSPRSFQAGIRFEF